MKKILLSLFTFLLLAHPALSRAEEGTTDASDQRQENQEKRIEEGVASGELTKKEAHRLKKQQKHIGKVEEKMEADGELSKKEAHKLNKMQNHASKAIHAQKHDRQERKRRR